MTKSYDPNEDYQKKMDEAAKAGDYAAAARYEQQRNEKIQGEGLTQYQTTNQYAGYLPKSNRQQMEEVMQRILNREDFSYDMNADALFQQYKDKFAKQGRLAMEDAIGKAAALTGGYGNSYAQSVGQQAYYDRLGQLDGIVPELYSLAKQKHDAEGDALWNQYNLLAGREADDYSRELAQQEYEAAKKAEERDRAYSLALQMLQSGVMPSEGLLSGSGISAEDAQKIYGAYAVPSYSGGGGGGYYGTEKDGLPTKNWTALFQAYQEGAGKGDLSGYYSELANLGREYDISEFEDYMAQNVDGYRTSGSNSMYGNGLSQVSFTELLQAAQSSNVERVRTLLDMYSGQLSESQWAQIEPLLEKRGIYE